MILSKTKRQIIANSGHFDNPLTSYIEDSGTHSDGLTEFIEALRIRDALLPKLEEIFVPALIVPDSLSLRESIDWINTYTKNIDDGLVLGIHINFNLEGSVNGAEGYHYPGSETSKQIAGALSRNVAIQLGIQNRGAFPDTATSVGELGIIRQTNPWASLVECFYVSNDADRDAYIKHGPRAVAEGIKHALLEIFGPPTPEDRTAFYATKVNL